MSTEQTVPCPVCSGGGVSRDANGMGGSRLQCHKCSGEGTIPNEECPDCGAPTGMDCDPGCPSADPPYSLDPDRKRDAFAEGTQFDRFLGKILLKEAGPSTLRSPSTPPPSTMRSPSMKNSSVSGDVLADEFPSTPTGEMPTNVDDLWVCDDCGEITAVDAEECEHCGAPIGISGEKCPECSAPAGTACDPKCSNASLGGAPGAETYAEGTEFDRFMKVALLNESRSVGKIASKPSPQRLIARRYQENPLGRIRIRGGR